MGLDYGLAQDEQMMTTPSKMLSIPPLEEMAIAFPVLV